MVHPILQSILTLVLAATAFGFMTWRLWHYGVLANTGARTSEE